MELWLYSLPNGISAGQTKTTTIALLDSGDTSENTPATGSPVISGTAQAGQTLTASVSGISDPDGIDTDTLTYQWIAGGTNISGATGSTYKITSSEVGKAIQVKVSFTDDADNKETLTSAATAAVAATVPTSPQSLTVTTRDQIQELDVSWQAPSSNGGSAVTGYRVQWKGASDSWDTPADVSQATVTGTSHTITGLTGGVAYTVRVTATNATGDGPASTEATGTPDSVASDQQNEEEEEQQQQQEPQNPRPPPRT